MPTGNQLRIGAIEAGGTKIVCSVGSDWAEIRDAEKFVVATTSTQETTTKVLDWFVARHEEEALSALGVASFGPIDFASMSIGLPPQKNRGAALTGATQ